MKLHTGNQFKRVLDTGTRIAVGAVVISAAPLDDPSAPSRLGLTVSRRVGNAVVRNRVKRALRETFRLVWDDLLPGYDLVVIARQSAAKTDTRRMAEDFCRCVKRLELWRPGSARHASPGGPFSSPTAGSGSGSSPSS